jgi:predicted Zn-dependent peptidase
MSARLHGRGGPARWHLVAIAAALACGISLAVSTQEPDRSAPPKPGQPPSLKLPPIQKQTLANGLPVWLVELHEVPVAQVNLLIKSGSTADPAGKFGLASFTAAMLDEGAGSRSALELADAIEFLGAAIATSSSFDGSTVRLQSPVSRLDEALELFADVALRPTLPPTELERLRKEFLTSFAQARDEPGEIANTAFPRVLYGPPHRYGTLAIGTPVTVRSFGVEDLKQFHATQFRPDNAVLIVVGDVTLAGIVPALQKAFGEWKTPPAPLPRPAVPDPPRPSQRRVYLVDKPDAAQSEIRIGGVGVPRSTPDFFPILVMNTILGGSFTSRLNQNLREKHGYSYGASSGFSMRLGPGPFAAGAAVQTDKTADALKEFFNELEGMLEPIPPDDVQKAKSYLALSFPAEFETTRGIAGALTEMALYGLADDYLSTYVPKLESVTAAEVERVAKRYIQPDRFAVVIVGDLKAIEAPVRALKLGPVEILPLDDVMGRLQSE